MMKNLLNLCSCCPVLTSDDNDFVQEVDEEVLKKLNFVVGVKVREK